MVKQFLIGGKNMIFAIWTVKFIAIGIFFLNSLCNRHLIIIGLL